MKHTSSSLNAVVSQVRIHKKLLILFLLFIATVSTYWFVEVQQHKSVEATQLSYPKMESVTPEVLVISESSSTANQVQVTELANSLEASASASDEAAELLLQQLQN